jgi:hypothetical protein
MKKCPKCGRSIKKLLFTGFMFAFGSLKGNCSFVKSFIDDDFRAGINCEYICPRCKARLFTKYEEACNFWINGHTRDKEEACNFWIYENSLDKKEQISG